MTQNTVWIVIALLGISTLAYIGASLSIWTVCIGLGLVYLTLFSSVSSLLLLVLWLVAFAIFFPLHATQFRKKYITTPIFSLFKKMQPTTSPTEIEAIESGTVDWDGELFSGNPNWNKLLSYPRPHLTEEEQAFLAGPVEELCRMIDNWTITHVDADLPPMMWEFIKKNGFFGLIIPKSFGGKGFSALAHSAILIKVAGRSSSVASTITVPNSLGPAELLLKYGTEQQKNYYLPRLACGDEVPCFALTAPNAGSDASSMTDSGIVCKKTINGEEILGIQLNWNKRYITLAPIATVLGLAFKLFDPDHLIGQVEEIGITCALIPTDMPGITIGRRHFPLNSVFQNGPTQGKDVFIPLDYIIGGSAMAGKGWRMLVECLSAGRAISLPSTSTGGAKIAVAATSVYARIREQFRLPIGYFEGVEEALARIVGYTYIMSSATQFTVNLIDQGQTPAVLSAISKYHVTELGRKVVNDAMDIHGGKGICLGPRNYLGREYQCVPIAITVEGANILTRSMIIFGQGAIRCHPYVLAEMKAAKLEDPNAALNQFDKVFFSHLAFILQNKIRTFWLGITGGRLSKAPTTDATRNYYQQLSRFSAALAFLTDISLFLLGGKLKVREKLSARLGDALSMLYLGSTVLKNYHDQGSPKEDMPLVCWSMDYILFQLQESLDRVLDNFPQRWLGKLLAIIVFPLGRRLRLPHDHLDKKIASMVLQPSETRARLLQGTYLTADPENRVGLMQQTFEKIIALKPIEQVLKAAIKEGKIKGHNLSELIAEAVAHGSITDEQASHYLAVEKERQDIIAVDDFAAEDLKHGSE